MAPQVLILRAPGTNCDWETQYAFELAGADCERIHVNQLLDQPTLMQDFQILCFPGGFSYGDDIAAGRILATQLHQGLADELFSFRDAGKLMLGICNGFQVLVKAGLFDDVAPDNPLSHDSPLKDSPLRLEYTLTWNDHGRFEDRWVNLKNHADHCVFLNAVDSLYLPMAHAEGKFVTRDESVLQTLIERGQVALTYCLPDAPDQTDVAFPYNPNGSEHHIAGICDSTGRVFGLMPHPERNIDPTHHPRWTREEFSGKPDGCQVFDNAVAYFA